MGIYGPSIRYFEALGSSPTIFQAEMYAINVCARICLTEGGNEGKHIYIMSDSQAALKALKAHTFKSKLVAECLDVLKRLTLKCTVTLRWVPGHTGVEGNEIADQLANEGSDSYFIGPEPFFGYNNTKCKLILDEWILRRKKAHFETLPPNSLARRFLSYSSKRTQELLTLTKSELKTITGILTGHNGLNYHMHRIGKSRDENCRLCLEESETAQHIICECPAIARVRLKHFDKGYLSPNEVKIIKPKEILNFLRAIKLEEV
jgi:RNase H